MCGGGYTVVAGVTWGCSGRRKGRGCDNAGTISNAELERRVLGALRDNMLAPDVVAEFVREFHRAIEAGRRERLSGRAALERRLARAPGQLDRLVDAIADGRGTIGELHARMRAGAAERDRLAGDLADLTAEPVLALHPRLADVYRVKLALANAVRADDPAAGEAREIIRGLIDGVIASPCEGAKGVDLDLQGRLAAILALTQESRPISGPASHAYGHTLEMVAGTRFHLDLRPSDTLLGGVATSLMALPVGFALLFSASG